MNLYAYVGNDPLNNIDPFGLKTVCNPTTQPGPDGEEEIVTNCHDDGEDDGEDEAFGDWRWFLRAAEKTAPAALFELMDPGRPLTQCERAAMAAGNIPNDVMDGARVHEDHGPMGLPMPDGAGLTLPRTYLGGSNVYVGTGSSRLGGIGLLGHELDHSTAYASGRYTHWSILGEYMRHGGHDNAPAEIAANARQAQVEQANGANATCP